MKAFLFQTETEPIVIVANNLRAALDIWEAHGPPDDTIDPEQVALVADTVLAMPIRREDGE